MKKLSWAGHRCLLDLIKLVGELVDDGFVPGFKVIHRLESRKKLFPLLDDVVETFHMDKTVL